MGIPSTQCINRLKTSEGFRADPYVCPAGYATIGYGHNLEAHPAPILPLAKDIYHRVKAGGLHGHALVDTLRGLSMVWDKAHAEHWLRYDIDETANRLASACPVYTKLIDQGDEARAEVLLDMSYNLGIGGLLGFRKMLMAVEEGDYGRAADEMLNSLWAKQVGKRAEKLEKVMRTGKA